MSAAEKLVGLTLNGGWVVNRMLARNPGGTGGTFSQSYEVRKGKEVGFLKAFDFQEAFSQPDPITALRALTDAYDHERGILEHCGQRRLSQVVLAVDHGNVQVPGIASMEGRVFYIIFELADGDVRCQMTTIRNFGTHRCMLALRDIALGLWQLHKEMIAHQDAKPSNVLSYTGGTFKIADFGRASWKGRTTWHDSLPIAGDRTYAPPELLYGHTHADFGPRRLGCDLYMLGNLAMFLFSGVNITAAMMSRLNTQHHPSKWTGTYQQVLPYLQNAFTQVLEDLKPTIDQDAQAFVIKAVSELCNPSLDRRGHPRGLGKHDQYSLERYVSQISKMCTTIEIKLRTNGACP